MPIQPHQESNTLKPNLNGTYETKGRDEIHRWHAESTDTAMVEARATASTEDARRMVRIMCTGA